MKNFKKITILLMLLIAIATGCSSEKILYKDCDLKLEKGILTENFQLIDEALNEGANIDSIKRVAFKTTNPLSLALDNNVYDSVEYLIEKGANINNDNCTRLLFVSAFHYDYDMCSMLIEKDVDINKVNSDNNTALDEIVSIWFLNEIDLDPIITLLLDNGAIVTENTLNKVLKANEGFKDFYSDDKHRMGRNYMLVNRILKELMKTSYNININPCLKAAILGNSKEVYQLISNGNVSSEYMEDVSLYTAAFGDVETMKLIDKYDNARFSLHDSSNYEGIVSIAAAYGNMDMIKYFVDEGMDVNKSPSIYDTPIIAATKYNNTEIVKYLMKLDKNLINNILDKRNNVLYFSCKNGNLELTKLFIENGLTIDNESFFEALRIAVVNNHIDVVKYLLDSNNDINIKDGEGNTLLYYVKNLETTKFLVEAGIDKNSYNPNNDIDILNYLLEQGASPEKLNKFAKEHGRSNLLELAKKYSDKK